MRLASPAAVTLAALLIAVAEGRAATLADHCGEPAACCSAALTDEVPALQLLQTARALEKAVSNASDHGLPLLQVLYERHAGQASTGAPLAFVAVGVPIAFILCVLLVLSWFAETAARELQRQHAREQRQEAAQKATPSPQPRYYSRPASVQGVSPAGGHVSQAQILSATSMPAPSSVPVSPAKRATAPSSVPVVVSPSRPPVVVPTIPPAVAVPPGRTSVSASAPVLQLSMGPTPPAFWVTPVQPPPSAAAAVNLSPVPAQPVMRSVPQTPTRLEPTRRSMSQPPPGQVVRVVIADPLEGNMLGLCLTEDSLVITDFVDPRATRFGFQVGDRIQKVNGVPVRGQAEFYLEKARALERRSSGGEPLQLEVLRPLEAL